MMKYLVTITLDNGETTCSSTQTENEGRVLCNLLRDCDGVEKIELHHMPSMRLLVDLGAVPKRNEGSMHASNQHVHNSLRDFVGRAHALRSRLLFAQAHSILAWMLRESLAGTKYLHISSKSVERIAVAHRKSDAELIAKAPTMRRALERAAAALACGNSKGAIAEIERGLAGEGEV